MSSSKLDFIQRLLRKILDSKLPTVEGHLQIEKEVAHVIVQQCPKLNPFLGRLTQPGDNLPILMLSRIEENSGLPFNQLNKALQTHEGKQATLFPEARNFKLPQTKYR